MVVMKTKSHFFRAWYMKNRR